EPGGACGRSQEGATLMASLYKPKIIEYRLPDGSYRTPEGERVTKDTPGAVRHVSKSPNWWGRYKDSEGHTKQVKLSNKKETAKDELAALTGTAVKARIAGIRERDLDDQRRPLLELLADWQLSLEAKDDVPDHVSSTVARCRAIIEGCKFHTWRDLNSDAVLSFLAERRDGKKVPELPPGQEWFTPKEVSILCGISSASVRRMTRRGAFPGEGTGWERRH